ncbi:MAG: (2Fe-2S)-binding protein [Xanthomonadales bacterium]|nr:(2Fe-2S)-binding protein [Xanthomonadales bacterium]
MKLTVNGSAVTADAGETVATVLIANGIIAFNRTRSGEPRGPYCNMGTCFECQVLVTTAKSARSRWLRACMTRAEENMDIRTGTRLPGPGPIEDAD